jgi:amino acid adenylation domain-containing protein
MAGRFPGAPDVDRFWRMLRDGREGIRRFSAAELSSAGVDAALSRRAEYVPACGALDGIETFDADFFGIPPREAALMDPQHRIFLEMAWEALEDAGYAGEQGLGRTGVYAGAGLSTYLLHNLLTSPDLARFAAPLQILIANNKDSMPTRVSYRLNLRGPSLNISTACSTSLVAVHVACQALLNQECDVALAGGIGIQVPQDRGYLYEPEGILSPDGHCRAFDRHAAGTVSGNGGGIVVLKRLEDAEADRDAIRAVILGTAINNDGAEKAGFTAPSVSGQMEVVAEALGLADVPADTIGYIEAHGTGTPVGDPIELRALTSVFRRGTERRQFCAIGSVKTNVGHLDEGAGVAGLIKTVLALEHRQIPPSLHYTEPNPECELETSPFFVPTSLHEWNLPDAAAAPRRAGVSSFGIGGTNAHVVLEEAPAVNARPAAAASHALTLSARSPQGLETLSTRLAERLQDDPSLDLADVAYTLRVGRRVFDFRRTVVCRDRADAIAQLRRPSDSANEAAVHEPADAANRRRVSLPATPFERKRYWIGAPASVEEHVSPAPAPPVPVESWLYTPGWTAAPRPDRDALVSRTGLVVAFVPRHRTAWIESLTAGLLARGAEIVTVTAAEKYLQRDALAFEVRPSEPDDYDALFAALSADGRTPATILHLWQVTGSAVIDDETMLTLGFDSVLCLAGAIGRLDARDFRLAVVTDGCQAVEPDDDVRPEKSTTCGLVRAAAVEFPSVACAHIDLDRRGPRAEEETAAVIADILDNRQGDPTIAYRNGRRLVPSIAPAVLRPASDASRDLIRDGGVYLITGGLGSMGLAFAEWIASRARATIVLAARPVAGSLAGSGLELTYEPRTSIQDLTPIAPIAPIDDLCGRLILEYVTGAGIDLRNGASVDEHALRDALAIAPRYRKMLDWCLDVLRDDGMIERRSGSITGRWDGLGPSAMELAARLRAKTPQLSGLVDLVVHCASRYRDVLSGRVEGTEVLYPDGTPTFLDAGFERSAEYSSDRVYLDALGRRIAALADLTPGRPLRIIEVGGGTGTLTHTIFRHLEGRPVEYTFTDVSRAFISAAETEAARRGLTGISFRRLDVASLVADQDFGEHAYDLVVGYNVVHATRDIHETLRNLRRLLVPGGEMCLVETVKTTRWDQMIWGLATGWWDFADGVRTISPLLGLDVWERVLTEAGFEGVDSVPRDNRRGTTDSGLIVGRAPAAVMPGATTDRLAAIAANGSRVEVERVDMSDIAAVQRLVADVRARFGRITGVIHTAGVIGRGFARRKSVAEARRVLAPKLGGARALEAALGGDPPDFLALCSSLASRYPVAGQTDYAAANAALDGFAHHYARASGTRVMSIGWGFWQELGMIEKSAMSKAEQRQIAEEISAKGWTTAGVDAFEAILFRASAPEVLVYPQELPGAADTPSSSRARPSHPLLIERIDEAGTPAYRVGFTAATRWILDEHRLDGDAVLPGTAYLELMRAAYAELHGPSDHGIELREVIFLRPFMTEPDRAPELRVILQEHDDRTDMFVVSQADSADRWHLCARAEILPLSGGDARATSIGALHEPPAGALPAEFANRMSGFGPRWENVAAVRFEGDAAIARLQLPASFESETSIYGLHPALLDNATGFFPIQRRTDARVPFSYQSIKIRRPLRGSILSRAMAHGPAGGPEESFEIELADDAGHVLVDISGYRFRRLKPRAEGADGSDGEETRDAALQIGTRGLLDTLSFAASARTAPNDDEVEIRVEATGINFMEVLYGLGMLPERRDGAFPFGLECAGIVTRAGARTALTPGQAVVAFANGTDRVFATVAARNVAAMPAGLSFEEAATIPGAYMTAYAALCEYGRLQPGERVLIHSACGGVGLAAVHVARWVGARIVATAGTEEKRAFLRQMGIETVMDSRNRAFVADTMAATGGAGVDVVLNSLSGELIEAGLSVLGPGGRFLELGKRDILEGAQLPMSHFQRRLSFIAVDVGPDLPEFGRLWRDVWARVASGEFPPLPRQTFAAASAAAAFAEMAKGRHIGKFVLSFGDRDAIYRQAIATPVDRGRTLTDILGPAPVRRSSLASPPPAPPAAAARAVDVSARPSGDAIERVIFGIWEDLLGRTDITRDDDFFEMNGDSLVGAQVISRMHQALGVKIPLSAIFDHPTVAQLGALVRKTSGAAPVIAAGMASGQDEPLVSAIHDVSAAQRRLWVLHQLDPGTAAYHIPLVHRIDGPLDVSALRQAIDWLTTRHEALRTTIPAEAGEPRQRIAATSGPLMTILDVSHRADPDQEASAETQRVIRQPFDLAVGPLARIVLIRKAAERHVLVVVLHHIIADGVSIAILMRDLQTAYAAAASGRALDVPRRAVQYRDCARWQEEYLERDEAAAHRDYWIDRLAAPLARIDLPTDFPRPAAASSDGTEALFVFDRDTVDALRRACRAHGATIFMGLVAVVKTLLHRYTGVGDVVVGTPAAGRDHADAASVVGVFINTLVLRDTVTPEMTFGDVLASVRETSKAAFDHAMYPFDRLVQDLNTDRDPGRSPVFDVMVILQNQQTESLAFPGLTVTPLEAHTATSKYDLTFNFHESGGAISMGIEYRTSLFGRGRITRMGAHLLRLTRDAIANPSRPIEQLELMPPDERELVVHGWNSTERAFALDRTVPDLFLERVRERPDAIAAACGDQTMTYGELGRRSSQIAAHLRRLGVGRGDIVAVHLDRSLDMMAALLGVLEAGAAYTPMDPSYPADRLQHQLRDSGARVILTAQELAGIADEKDSASPLLPAADDLAYVIYTSGSTGAPKGVQITHRNLTNLLFSMAEAPGLRSNDVLLAVTSLSFDIAGLELFLPLITGARLVIATTDETHDGVRLLARATACGANVMQGTPATWRLLIAAGWRGSSSFKALCGGELLSDSLADDLLQRAGEVWNLYGPTETTIWSMLHRVAPTGTVRYPHAGVPIGRPIANTSAYLLDRNRVPVPRGYPGDLYLGGEGVAPGYLNRPDLTADRFVTDPFGGPGTIKTDARRMYRTGDRAVALEDGSLQFLGRDDHQVKIRGFRVELGEIEEALARHPAVAEAVAIAMGESTDHTLVAYVVLDTGAAFDPVDLRAHVAKSLAPQAIPSLIMRLDRLPLTPNGKIDRRALPRPDRASVGAPLAVAPRDARERTIRDVWASVLDLDEIGIHDNFFELGGHSLRATRVTYLLQSALGVDVSLIDIFKAPTIAELAERLTARPAFSTIGIAPMTPEEAQLLGDL